MKNALASVPLPEQLSTLQGHMADLRNIVLVMKFIAFFVYHSSLWDIL